MSFMKNFITTTMSTVFICASAYATPDQEQQVEVTTSVGGVSQSASPVLLNEPVTVNDNRRLDEAPFIPVSRADAPRISGGISVQGERAAAALAPTDRLPGTMQIFEMCRAGLAATGDSFYEACMAEEVVRARRFSEGSCNGFKRFLGELPWPLSLAGEGC